MLYLIKDSRGSKILIKVGIAKNLEQRMATYKTHNPYAKLIQTATILNPDKFERQAETACHQYFKAKGFKQIDNTEWYQVPKHFKKYKFEDIEEYYKTQPLYHNITNYKK